MGIQGINRDWSSQYKQIDKKVLGYKLNGEYKTTEFRILQKKDSFILSEEYKGFAEKEETPKITSEGEFVFVNHSISAVLKEDNRQRNWKIQFDNADDLQSIAEDGYLQVNGRKIVLTDKERKNFKTIADNIKKFNELKSKFCDSLKNLSEVQKQANEKNEEFLILKITLLYGSGKDVHEKDLKFLREKDPEMFSLAIKMRSLQSRIEKNRKKKSLVEEAKEKSLKQIDAIEYEKDKVELNIDVKNNKVSEIKTVSEKVIA